MTSSAAFVRAVSGAMLFIGLLGRSAAAQEPIGHAVIIDVPDDRSGPRLGVAYLTRGSETARNLGKSFSNPTSLFGWQLEHPFPLDSVPVTVVTELVFLVGGLEQNLVLPSMTWLIGVRRRDGIEVGVGPTITGSGTQLAFAAGVTHRFGTVNVPVNVAIAPAKVGMAITVTAGFNTSR
jgi:hypothetical protein